MHVVTKDDDQHKFGDMLFYQTTAEPNGEGWLATEIDYYDDTNYISGPDPDSAFKALDKPLNLKSPQAS